MRRLLAFVTIAVVLLAWSLSTRGKEGEIPFFAGAGLLLCTLAIGSLRRFGSARSGRRVPATDVAAVAGAGLGLLAGGLVGANSGCGRVMISIFNPDLPERDFSALFGAIGGGLLGACLGAILGSVVHGVVCRPRQTGAIDDGDDRIEADHE